MTVEKIKKGVATTLLIGLALTSLGGCTFPAKAAASTNPPTTTPVATQTIIPSPTITPTTVPSPTPFPTLTLEQKQKLIGISGGNTTHEVGNIDSYTFVINGLDYRIWAYSLESSDPKLRGEEKVYSLDNDVYLFTLKLPQNKNVPDPKYYEYATNFNPNLMNYKLKDSVGIPFIDRAYTQWGKDYKNNETLKEWRQKIDYGTNEEGNAVLRIILTKEQAIELYINSTPDNEIMPFWLYTPGAKIPDELKGLYPESVYPPAPAETTVQQSSRQYNGFGYETFTSKDGASNLNYTFDKTPQKDTVDDNIIHGYRTKNYYGNTYVVTGRKPYNNPNLNPDQHTKIKI